MIAPLQVRDHALELAADDAVAVRLFIAQLQFFPFGAVKDGIHGFGRKGFDWIGKLKVIALRNGFKVHAGDAVGPAVTPAGRVQSTVFQAELPVLQNNVRVDPHLDAQAGAGRAGAVRIVEREQSWGDFLQGDAAVRAGIILGKGQLFPPVVEFGGQQSAGKAEGRFGRVGHAAPRAFPHGDAVDDDFNRVLFVFIQRDLVPEVIHQSVHSRAHITGALRILQDLPVFPLLPADDGCQQRKPGSLRQNHQAVNHLVDSLLPDFAAAVRAVRNADARIQQAQIVVNLGYRAHGRTRILRGCLLVDGNRRGKPVDGIDIGLVHLAEEHPRIGAQAFHIAPLPLGIHGVEGKAGFAAPGKPRDDGQFVARDDHVDILQIILSGALDADVFLHRFLFLWRALFRRTIHSPKPP